MDSPGVSPLQSFPCFSNLPVELRLKIWRYCQPGPRLVIFSKYARYSKHDSKESPAPPAPTILFVNRESREETLKEYCLIHPQFHSFTAFNANRDTLLLCHSIWPKVQYGFFILKPYAGAEFEIRSLALSFASIEAEFEELLNRMLTYPFLGELVLWQERNWEDSIPMSTIDISTGFDAWFKLRTEAHRLRGFIQYLSDNASHFASGRPPGLKFMRVKEDVLGKGDDCLSEFCYPFRKTKPTT